jgi:integrase
MDPAASLKGALKTRPPKHYPHLRRNEIGEFVRKLVEYPGRPETRLALQILLLTFVRPGELRAAKWAEFDLAGREWRIPADRMKMGLEHIVPLSRQAMTALKELSALTGYSTYLFPGGRGRYPYMSENTLNKAIALLGYKGKLVSHGFRATASTILNESSGFNPDVIERQLAHRERNAVRAIYHRAEYLAQRKVMMQWWADCLDGLGASDRVVPIKRKLVNG